MTEEPKCDVLILFPKQDELRAAAAVFDFDADEPESRIAGKYECWSTELAGLQTRFVLADAQGGTLVALATTAALQELDPAVALCVGTAAGRQAQVSYMDVVLATSVLNATEWRTKAGEDAEPQWEQLDPGESVKKDIDRFVKDKSWRAEAITLLDEGLKGVSAEVDQAIRASWPGVKDGWVATTDFLHEDQVFLGRLWDLHSRLRVVDMETAGFVAACKDRAHQRPWIVIRAVSDLGTADSKRDDARPGAGVAAAVVARCFITNGLQRAHPIRIETVPPSESVLSAGNFFSRMSMSDFLAEEVPKHFGVPFDVGMVSRELTIGDLAALCGGEDAIPKLNDLREEYFATKYGEYDDEADVRKITGSAWVEELIEVYGYLGIALDQADILYVGVSTGRDLSVVCPQFKSLTGVDLSTKMLRKASEAEPRMTRVRDSAESLSFVPDRSADLYLSLRTFQSSLLDVPAALRQAYRVLRANGGFVASIPGGFLDQSGGELRYVPGLLVPGSTNVVDRSLPRRHAEQILSQIERMPFSRVGFHQREGDIYIYGRKI